MPTLIPTISATVLADVPEFIQENFGPKALKFAYDISGIPAGVSGLENAYIPETSVAIFVEAAARLTGEHQLGLILAPYSRIENYGVLADYCLEGETMGDVMARCMKLIRFHASHDCMALHRHGDSLKWASKYASHGAPSYDQIAYGGIGAQINFLRMFTEPDWLPDVIYLDIPKPRVTSLLEDLYPCPVVFDAPELGLTFDREFLNLRHRRKPAQRSLTISDVRRSRIATAPSGVLSVTTNIIKSQMRASKISQDETARLLGFSRRTLQRELDFLGFSFRKLTNHIRMDIANELLQESNLSLTEIANELQYSSHSHFTRAYRAKTSMTPSQFRQIAKAEQFNVQ